jgi:uncharacterized protein YjbI with pentapeptide repeats
MTFFLVAKQNNAYRLLVALRLQSNLSDANLSGAILRLANLRDATLNRINLNWAEPPRVLAQSCRFEQGQFAQYEPAQNPYGEGHFTQRRITESQPS